MMGYLVGWGALKGLQIQDRKIRNVVRNRMGFRHDERHLTGDDEKQCVDVWGLKGDQRHRSQILGINVVVNVVMAIVVVNQGTQDEAQRNSNILSEESEKKEAECQRQNPREQSVTEQSLVFIQGKGGRGLSVTFPLPHHPPASQPLTTEWASPQVCALFYTSHKDVNSSF